MRRALVALAAAGLFICIGACTLFGPPPVADFDVSPLVVYAGDRFALDASGSRGDLVDYRWTIAGTAQSGREITATLPTPGVIVVRLTVEDTRGRTASVERELVVYARSGTRIFSETFSDGLSALGRWPLDATWAVPGQSTVEQIAGLQGFVLAIRSSAESYHRRSARVEAPPLRVGQWLTFVAKIMVLQVQERQTLLFAPARSSLSTPPSGLPYFVYSTEYGGSSIRVPSRAGGVETAHPVPFIPAIYVWNTYNMSFSSNAYRFSVNGVVLQEGSIDGDAARGGTWWFVLGDESLNEECRAYFDDIVVSVEE